MININVIRPLDLNIDVFNDSYHHTFVYCMINILKIKDDKMTYNTNFISFNFIFLDVYKVLNMTLHMNIIVYTTFENLI